MRLIDADELTKNRVENDPIKIAVDCAPTIYAKPVQQGHIIWKERYEGGYKYKDVKCHNCGSIESIEIEHPTKTKIAYCSECGKRLDDIFINYCPNCGAKVGLNN